MNEHTNFSPAQALMQGLTVQHLRFAVRATEWLSFSDQPGSALRGGLYQALADHFCSERFNPVSPDHSQRCPVCWLLAFENPMHQRGRDVARPLTIQPPDKSSYANGSDVTFGISLVGAARDLLPYVVRAVEWMGDNGVGKGRGRFRLQAVHEYSPLWDTERLLMDGKHVYSPTLAVNAARVADKAAELAPDRITLRFLTPTRLTANGKLMKTPEPGIVIARLLERCQNLVDHYCECDSRPVQEHWKAAAAAAVEQARGLQMTYNDVSWVEVMSGSKRRGHATPISGFLGTVRWEGDLAGLHEWLLWGQSLHVGKDAVKGNGWYHIIG